MSTERLKENSYIKYSNLIPHCLYDGAIEEILVKINNLSKIPVITINQSNKINHFQAFNLYYTNIGNRYISCDLIYRRLDHINKKLTRKLVIKISTRLILKEKESGNTDRYNEYMTDQIKAKPFPKK